MAEARRYSGLALSEWAIVFAVFAALLVILLYGAGAVAIATLAASPPDVVVALAVLLATFVLTVLTLNQRLPFALSCAGGVLVLAYSVRYAFEVPGLLGAVLALVVVLFVLVRKASAWALLLAVAIAAIFGLYAMLAVTSYLAVWGAGAAVAQWNRPELVEPTLRKHPIIQVWPWVGLSVALILVWVFVLPLHAGQLGSWNLNLTVDWSPRPGDVIPRKLVSLLSGGQASYWALLLIAGSLLLTGSLIYHFKRLFWSLLVAVIASGLLLTVPISLDGPYGHWTRYAAFNLAVVFAPLVVINILAAARSLVPSKWVEAGGVAVAGIWAYVVLVQA